MTTLLDFAPGQRTMGRPPGNPPPRIDWKDPEQKRAYKAAQQRERQAAQIAEQLAAGVKACNRCKIEKPFDQFEPDERKSLGIRGRCKACCNAARLARYHDPAKIGHERVRSRQAAAVVRDKAIEIYGGHCELCGDTHNLEFDHIDWNGAEHRKVEDAGSMKQRIATTGQRLTDYRLRLVCGPCHRRLQPVWSRQALALRIAASNNWPMLIT